MATFEHSDNNLPNWPRRAYADGPFGQIHFQMLGQGAPLLLLHQAPMTSSQFDSVYEFLAAQGVQAIGIDMPGFGMSDPTPFTPTISDYARVVPTVLDNLGLDRAAVLGHHTGALVAVEAAVSYPDRVSTLIINGPLLATEQERTAFLTGNHQWELGYRARPRAEHMVELFAIRDRLASGTISPEQLSGYVVQALLGRGAFWHGHHAAYTYDLAKQLPRIEQPALILTNTGDMLYEHALRVHRLRPDFDFHALEGGGVDIVDQQPQGWTDAVTSFLRKASWASDPRENRTASLHESRE